MMVLVDDADGSLITRRPTWRECLAARCRGSALDLALARGAPPESDVLLALRAQHLIRPQTRQWLAQSLRRILAEACRPSRGPAPSLSPCARQQIRGAATDIQLVIEGLERPAPLPSRGVAQVCALLSDGRGPLYAASPAGQLQARLRAVQQELEPLTTW
jgi:hypothetical protein